MVTPAEIVFLLSEPRNIFRSVLLFSSGSTVISFISSHSLFCRPICLVLSFERFFFLQLLCNIGASSQECLLYPDHSLNEPGPSPENLLSDMECDVIDSVLEQNTSETKRVENDFTDPRFDSKFP